MKGEQFLLRMIVALLMMMFLGTTMLAHLLSVTPLEEETVVSQIGR